MNARLQNKVFRSQRRIRRNRELDRAETITISLCIAAIIVVLALI